jgi:hypothetical protein
VSDSDKNKSGSDHSQSTDQTETWSVAAYSGGLKITLV